MIKACLFYHKHAQEYLLHSEAKAFCTLAKTGKIRVVEEAFPWECARENSDFPLSMAALSHLQFREGLVINIILCCVCVHLGKFSPVFLSQGSLQKAKNKHTKYHTNVWF